MGDVKARELVFEATAWTVSISPQHQVPLGASNANSDPWEGVSDPLEFNAALFRCEELDVLLCSIDALYAGPELRREIVRRSGLPQERVFVFASHTHRAPMLDSSKSQLGRTDDAHMRMVIDRIGGSITESMGSRKAVAELHVAEGTADHSINRRRWKLVTLGRKPIFARVVNAPNRGGARDEEIITATIRDVHGKAIAAIWNYACHPVGSPHRNAVSAHFPGAVRERIRREEGDTELPVIFLQGFSGNTRPSATAIARSLVRRAQRFLTGPVFEDMDRDAYQSWVESLARAVQRVRINEQPVSINTITASRVEVDAENLFTGRSEGVSFARLSLGPQFAVVGVGAEVMAEYAPKVRQADSARFVCCAGCMDDTFGYLPTNAILREGGYEATGFLREFGIAELHADIEGTALKAIADVQRAPAE